VKDRIQPDELEALRRQNLLLAEENVRLKEMLGLEAPSRAAAAPIAADPTSAITASSSGSSKIELFQSLFRGRADVFARRWESRSGGSGYAPACANEWRSGLCDKPRVKCADCANRELVALSASTIEDHLTGRSTVGIYAMLEDETCHFLAIDFDDEGWRGDVTALRSAAYASGVECHVEVSRSGGGAHAWFFFAEPVPAALARRLGTALLTQAARGRHALSLRSYDRLFPSQDTMPRGGFGNLIALPLQHEPRSAGRSVFVDEQLRQYSDQWAYLSSVVRLERSVVDAALSRLVADGSPLGVRNYPAGGGGDTPWALPVPPPRVRPELIGHVPAVVRAVRANLIFVEKAGLPDSLLDQIARLAAFENPEFHRAQAMRLPTWDKPRIISCAQEFDAHLALPRGCLNDLREVIEGYGSELEVTDERTEGSLLLARFSGTLRPEQRKAAKAVLEHDDGVLSAGTAFGKTVVAANVIAKRGVSTLVLVHRRELMEQWRERLSTFLDVPLGSIGVIGGGKRKSTGTIDIAVLQSLVRKGSVDPIVVEYGQVIIDECHHVSAFSFEAVLRQARARFVLGLTATPIRKDGHHPIITMQCGPVRFKTDLKRQAAARPFEHIVRPRETGFGVAALAADGIQEVYRLLAGDEARNALIVEDVVAAASVGRSALVLTERTAHRDLLASLIAERTPHVFALSSGMGVKKRAALVESMAAVPEDESSVLVATGRLVGEGFDDARLDTLFLAMPISWRGTLQQYAGRLHRLHDEKREVVIYDYVDPLLPVLERMWEKRLRGYRAMGYRVEATVPPNSGQAG
jgi:superfamily II DNA or RNA helicase